MRFRGRSFKGQILLNADFRSADIRGADFTDAVLQGADFTQAKAGIPPTWLVFFGVCLAVLALVSGYITGYASALPAFVNSLLAEAGSFARGLLTLVMLVLLSGFVATSLRQGLGAAVAAYAVTGIAGFVMVAGLGDGDITAAAVVVLLGVAGAIVGTILIAVIITFCRVLVRQPLKAIVPPATIICIGAILGILEGTDIANNLHLYSVPELVICGCLMLVLIGFGGFIGWRASLQDSRYFLLQTLAISVCTSRGTRFNRADLSAADFSEALLHQTDFRQAILTRTRLSQVQGLSQARLHRTYLENAQVRRLVISGQGREEIFDQLDLRGVNLKGAVLTDASFIGTNLGEATLEEADLSRAKLVQTQLYRANLNGTRFTGAYIEDWGISVETQLEAVQCDYIYMHLPTKNDPDPCRKPDNRNEIFQPGDFAAFIAPIIKTLDLYRQQDIDLRKVATTYNTIDLFHHEGIDPGAAAIAFQQLAEKHPEAGIEVVALEGRGNDKIRLQARVAKDSDRSELSTAYFQAYSQLKALPVADLQALLSGVAEKDAQISRLEAMLETAIQQPKFYVETYQNQGEFVMSQNNQGSVSIGDVGGNVSGIAAAGKDLSITGSNLGEVSGQVTQTINQLPDPPDASEEENLKALLTQLQKLIEIEPALSDEDKVEALEQVQVLAEVGQAPEDGPLKKAAKTSMKILKGTAAALPDVTELVEGFNKLLPAIATLLVLV